jgi:protein SCO1/2
MMIVRGCMVLLAMASGATGCSLIPTSPSAAPLFAQRGTWTDENGEPLALERFRGAPLVVTAFYTSCTVRCPLTIGKLKDLDDAFRKSGRLVPIVLLTLDPHTDTPDRLQRFKQAHKLPDNWHFLWGSDTDTRGFAHYLRMNAAYDGGHIDHDVRIAVFDADGRWVRGFSGWSFDVNAAVVP